MMIVCIAMLLFSGIVFYLKKDFFGVVFGMILLGNAINLAIFYGSNPKIGLFAFIAKDGTIPASNDPLPQALVLTAIVIGFALLGFLVALVKKIHTYVGDFSSRDMLQEDTVD